MNYHFRNIHPSLPETTRHAPPEEIIGTEPLSTVDQIQNLILDSADFEEFLNELARFSAHQVAGAGDDALCGITLLRDRKAATIGWSSDSAREVDEIQYRSPRARA